MVVTLKTEEEKNKDEEHNEIVNKYVQDILESDLTCAICHDIYINPLILNCSHSFCKFCVYRWLSKQSGCPQCRMTVSFQSENLALRNIINRMVLRSSTAFQANRSNCVSQRLKDEEELEKDGGSLKSLIKDHSIQHLLHTRRAGGSPDRFEEILSHLTGNNSIPVLSGHFSQTDSDSSSDVSVHEQDTDVTGRFDISRFPSRSISSDLVHTRWVSSLNSERQFFPHVNIARRRTNRDTVEEALEEEADEEEDEEDTEDDDDFDGERDETFEVELDSSGHDSSDDDSRSSSSSDSLSIPASSEEVDDMESDLDITGSSESSSSAPSRSSSSSPNSTFRNANDIEIDIDDDDEDDVFGDTSRDNSPVLLNVARRVADWRSSDTEDYSMDEERYSDDSTIEYGTSDESGWSI